MVSDVFLTQRQEWPRVSVIIPTFNSGRTILRALSSVRTQTYQNLEVVIADDASTDNTCQIIEQAQDTRVILVRSIEKTNRGPAAARNRALAKARGTYIAFLDSDDEWFPEKVFKQVEYLDENPNCSIVVSNAYDISPIGEAVETEFDSRKPQAGPEAWRLLLKYSFIETSSVMARAEVIQRVSGFDERLLVSQDQDLWIRLALQGSLGVLGDVMGKIHKSPSGHMTRNRRRELDIMLPMIERHVQTQRARLSKAEINEILGARYEAVGRNLFAQRDYMIGIKLLMKGSLRHDNWLENILYLLAANPLAISIKQTVRRRLGSVLNRGFPI